MTTEEMKAYLTKVQNDMPETRMLNAILTCFERTETLEKLVIQLQEKVNQIISEWNDKESAAPIQQEEDAINNEMPQEVIEDVDKC